MQLLFLSFRSAMSATVGTVTVACCGSPASPEALPKRLAVLNLEANLQHEHADLENDRARSPKH